MDLNNAWREERIVINVGGFLFEDEATAAQARKEEEGVRFIKEKSALNNPEVVLKLYKTILQQKLFVTPVGLRFLIELQSFLMSSDSVIKDDIPAIDSAAFIKPVIADEQESKKNQEAKKAVSPSREKYYKNAFHVSLFFAIIFGISVLGMFAIAEISSDNVTIINYRNKIIDEYEQWEQELEGEEDRLKEWEESLSEREKALEEALENTFSGN